MGKGLRKIKKEIVGIRKIEEIRIMRINEEIGNVVESRIG